MSMIMSLGAGSRPVPPHPGEPVPSVPPIETMGPPSGGLGSAACPQSDHAERDVYTSGDGVDFGGPLCYRSPDFEEMIE
jgi:hypothetical protein